MILLFVAWGLLLPVALISYFYVDKKAGYFKDTALNIDIFANRQFRSLWNRILRTQDGYLFGVQGETISSALGKNERMKTLSKRGKLLCYILDKLDKGHCKNSINDYI